MKTAKASAHHKILLIGGCGYIGSYLFQCLLARGFQVSICDTLNRGNPLALPITALDYNDLTEEELAPFNAVLWFGGHSSVGQSITDPQGAIANNCLNLFSFAKKLPSRTKLIYASTASLYPLNDCLVPITENSLIRIPAQNAYDISKFAFDYLAEHFLERFHGLRMGTVSGYSPNLRPELIFNAMNLSAVKTGMVRVKNAGAYRTILFLSDLWILVEYLIRHDAPSGFYNAGSITASIGEFGQQIANAWGAAVIEEGESPTYSFKLDCSKAEALCGLARGTEALLDECRAFIQALGLERL
ncbi:MAG: NAD(P)-dependent oxidoreductase [Roseomonas sp.]|nr:NAD(P)-dependent oxidoreductase [Roseomonas sp.]